MIKRLSIFYRTFVSALKSRQNLALENLALRQQLAVLNQSSKRPRISDADRAFWAVVSRIWSDWRYALVLVKSETVVRWHRQVFRRRWTRKCRPRGRPTLDPAIKRLIRRLSRANPLWGAPRIHGELLKLGVDVSESVVSKYMIRRPKPPSQSWKMFLANHEAEILATDFFTVPTATFKVLFVMVVLSHSRREILHTNVTEDPTEIWAARQLLEAMNTDNSRRYLLRDRDVKFGEYFSRHVKNYGMKEVLTAPASPWQNAYVEHVIGSMRRECFDHAIVFGANHCRRLAREYSDYYSRARTHLSLGKDAPVSRPVQPDRLGVIVSRQHLAGFHHEYYRRAA